MFSNLPMLWHVSVFFYSFLRLNNTALHLYALFVYPSVNRYLDFFAFGFCNNIGVNMGVQVDF
jgi:hypothetical protein